LSDILASYADPPAPAVDSLEYTVTGEEKARAAERLPSGAGPVAALQLGANNDLRRWPLESFAQLARGLLEQGVRVLLVGSSQERPLAERLLSYLGAAAPQVANLMGGTSLSGLAGLLACCDLVVSNDTGTLHLATAVGSRVLALFMGPAQAHETGPYGPGHLVLQARDRCGPCWEKSPVCQGRAPCRGLITPAAVLKAAQALLQGASAQKASENLGLPEGVEPLQGAFDRFGQHYRQLRPRPLGTADGLALGLREAGRMVLRSGYESQAQETGRLLKKDFLPPRSEEARALSGLAKLAASLAQAARDQDQKAAARIASQAPGLKSLAGLVGPRAPAALAPACRAAAQVLGQAPNC
jgi:hypothetical protein